MRTSSPNFRSSAVRISVIAALGFLASAHGGSHAETGVEFNSAFLQLGGGQRGADLSMFAAGNSVLPGDYVVDVLVNGVGAGRREVRFDKTGAAVDAMPCLTAAVLDELGVNVQAFPALLSSSQGACVSLSAAGIPDARVEFDASRQTLELSIPQAAMRRSARGAVSPEQWDEGINAIMLNYRLNATQYKDGTNADPTKGRAIHGGLQGGFNVGGWRFRAHATYSRERNGKGALQVASSYLQRALPSLRSQLLVGDGSTSGGIFDGFQFRGVQMSSDDSMLADSLRGYAPTIRGIARTNATVTVRQNGYVIYSTYVAPGPFEIDDLYPMSGSGDLEVVVTEADGQQTKFLQPFSAVPTLQREGQWSYRSTAGQYRSGHQTQHPHFLQATAAHGIGGGYTLFGGVLGAAAYQSGVLGVGANLGDYGAVSLDLSHARSKARDGAANSGQSVRFLYSKSFASTATDFRLLGYRYSTPGYRTFAEAVAGQSLSSPRNFHNRRSRIEGSVSQRMGKFGSFYGTISQQAYWGTSATDTSLQAGYAGSYEQLNYSVSVIRTQGAVSGARNTVMFNLSIPLGASGANVSYFASRNDKGTMSQQATVYGTAMDDDRLSYSVGVSQDGGQSTSENASIGYTSSVGRFDIGRSQGKNYSQTSISAAGGLVIHADGVTLSQELGDTIALVQVPGVHDVGVATYAGVTTDSAGNAVVPNLNAYRKNRLVLDSSTLGDGVDLQQSVTEVVPTRGAIIRATFAATSGIRVLVRLSDSDGQPLPFGAVIEDSGELEKAMVGEGGVAFLSSVKENEALRVSWGKKLDERCSFLVPAPVAPKNASAVLEEIPMACSRPLSGNTVTAGTHE